MELEEEAAAEHRSKSVDFRSSAVCHVAWIVAEASKLLPFRTPKVESSITVCSRVLFACSISPTFPKATCRPNTIDKCSQILNRYREFRIHDRNHEAVNREFYL